MSDGSFEIVLAPRARPGNWLPTGGIDRYVVVLRLYDTPVGVATRTAKDAPMPAVTARSVRMIRWLLWLLGGLLLGGIVHLATVLLLPRTATQDAYTRLSAAAPANSIVRPARSDAGRCGAAVHGSGLRHGGVPLRSRRRSAQAARAGEPGLHVGVVLYAQRHRLLRDQRSRGRPAHHRARSDDDRSSAPSFRTTRKSPPRTG